MKGMSKAEAEPSATESQDDEQKLMRSVLENDENVINDGKLVSQATHQGFSSFTPDMMFDQLTKDYSTAKNIYGEKLIRLLSGYEPSYIERNVKIPEFKKELQSRIEERMGQLKDRKVIDREGQITDLGFKLGSLILYTEELNKLIPEGFIGEKVHKKSFHYGEKDDVGRETVSAISPSAPLQKPQSEEATLHFVRMI